MFQALNEKYGTPTPQPMTKERDQGVLKSVDTWRSSPSIVALSEYLKANRDHGIGLVLLDGRPSLHFEPGLDYSDADRLAITRAALDKLWSALPDMDTLIERGLLAIPNHPGFSK